MRLLDNQPCSTTARFRFALLLGFGSLSLGCAGLLLADEPQAAPDLTVHEWGTFTAVAGSDGRAMQWQTLRDSGDLPGFVEHAGAANFKSGLRGTIRMETPVLYFYSPRAMNVSVSARFVKGVITEWYPHARTQPSEALQDTDLRHLRSDGAIFWRQVTISPDLGGEFPREVPSSRYYAARETASSLVSVNAKPEGQKEKFLFYRGVSAASLPISAVQNAAGDLVVRNLDTSEIPAMILFERRGDRVGYRLENAAADTTEILPPELTGNLESLLGNLEELLVDQGLYRDEARAMIETWRDSWFEEGSRLIYIVPRGFVDKILPLTIDPAPAQVVRVFVGRLEIVTPLTVKAVKSALATHDKAVLPKYGRFLEPILEIASEQEVSSAPTPQANP